MDDGTPLTPRHEKLGQVLRELRKKSKVTQAALAETLRRPQPFVSKYETGRLRIDGVELIEISDAIRCSLNEVAGKVLAVRQGPELAAGLRRKSEPPSSKSRAAGNQGKKE